MAYVINSFLGNVVVVPTATPTATTTSSPTNTATVTPTKTPTGSPTATPTITPTVTATKSATSTPTPTQTYTVTPTGTSEFINRTFYLSSTTGSDSNDGLTSNTPWATISKLQGTALQPGDHIYFKRGDTFLGSLFLTSYSGTTNARIVYDAYGSGTTRPIITLRNSLTGWNSTSTWTNETSYITTDSRIYDSLDGIANLQGNYRNILPGNFLTTNGSKVRMKLWLADQAMTVNGVYIGEQDIAVNAYSMKTGTISAFTFTGSTTTTLPVGQAGDAVYTDWINYTFDKTKAYVMSFSMSNVQNANFIQGANLVYDVSYYSLGSTAASNVGTASVSGYSTRPNTTFIASFEISDNTNKIWSKSHTYENSRMFFNGQEYARSFRTENVSPTNRWFFDSNVNKMYVWSNGNPATFYSNIEVPDNGQNFTLYIGGMNNLTFRNLDFQGGYHSTLIRGGDNLILEDCNFGRWSGVCGLSIQNSQSYTPVNLSCNNGVMRRCTIDSADYMRDDWFRCCGKGSEDGLNVGEGVSNWQFYNNEWRDWGHSAIYVINFNTYPTYNLKFFNNKTSGANVDYGRGLNCDGISGITYNIEFYNNLITNHNVRSQVNVLGTKIYNNIFSNHTNSLVRWNSDGAALIVSGYNHQTPQNLQIVNNVFADNDEYGLGIIGGDYGNGDPYYGHPKNCMIQNNIFYNNSRNSRNGTNFQLVVGYDVDVDNNTYQNNMMYKGSNTDLVQYRRSSNTNPNYAMTVAQFNAANGTNSDVMTGNIANNPLLVNTAVLDYSLQTGSPAINAGLTLDSSMNKPLLSGSTWPNYVINSSFSSSWNIGAYIHDSQTIRPTPTITNTNTSTPTTTPTPTPTVPSVVNLLSFSEDFTNAAWTKSDVTISPDTTTSPANTVTADQIVDNTNNAGHYIFQQITKSSSSITYTYSIYVKLNTLNIGCELVVADSTGNNGGYAGFYVYDSAQSAAGYTGLNGTGFSVVGSAMTATDGFGFRRLSFSVTSNTDTGFRVYYKLMSNGFQTTYAGTGQNMIIWGAQLEVGSSAGTYRKTP